MSANRACVCGTWPGSVSPGFAVGVAVVWVGVAGAVGVVVLDVLDRARIHSFHDLQPVGIVLPVSFSLLGAIIVSRQPGNRIGWIYLLIGVLMPWQALAALYFERSVISGGLPGARWAAWLNNWVVPLVFPAGLSLFAFLLFPGGRLPSRRWRPVAWLAVAVTLFGLFVDLGRSEPDLGLVRPARGGKPDRCRGARRGCEQRRRRRLVAGRVGAARGHDRRVWSSVAARRPTGAPASEAARLCGGAHDRLPARAAIVGAARVSR